MSAHRIEVSQKDDTPVLVCLGVIYNSQSNFNRVGAHHLTPMKLNCLHLHSQHLTCSLAIFKEHSDSSSAHTYECQKVIQNGPKLYLILTAARCHQVYSSHHNQKIHRLDIVLPHSFHQIGRANNVVPARKEKVGIIFGGEQ